MKAGVLALVMVLCTTCGNEPPHWDTDVLILDPLTTDASTVDDLHEQEKRAVCQVDTEAMLQLCADKGFDGVTFSAATGSDQLRKRAEQLKLPVLIAPSGSADRRTTNGS